MDRLSPVRVLVADDDSAVRDLVKRYLSGSRYEIVETSSGQDALHHPAAELDLLITDEVMSGIQGHALAGYLRSQNSDLKVLYLTQHADNLFDAKPSLFEREAFLDKPFTEAGLREAVALLMTEGLAY